MIKCRSIIKWYKKWLTLITLDKKKQEQNPNWPQIPGDPYRIIVIGGSGSGKINSLFNLIN